MTQQLELTGGLASAGITQGIKRRLIFACISGLPGVGKTTFAANAPEPIFLGLESGTYQKKVARFPKAKTLEEFLKQLRLLSGESHPFRTVVLDSADALEALIWKEVCKEGNVDSIEEYQGGFGKGRIRAGEIWRAIMLELEPMAERYHVLLTGHTQVKTFQDPNQPAGYDRYILRIDERAAAVIRETVDVMLFAMFRTDITRNRKSKETRAVTDGTRVMYTQFRPAFLDAKNRFDLPFEMPLDWNALREGVLAFYEPPKSETTQNDNGQ